jgi:hypothetical protein
MAVATIVLGSACDAPLEVDCPAVVRPSLQLDIRDASTGRPAWFGARVAAFTAGQAVPFKDVTARADSLDQILLTTEFYAPGLFDVIVEKTGYDLWTALNVRVESSGPPCPVTRTVILTARLQAE